MSKIVQTVMGPIAPSCIGVTLSHEHIFIDATLGWWQDPENPEDNLIAYQPVTIDKLGYLRHNPLGIKDNLVLDDIEVAQRELLILKQAGGQTIVELSILGLYNKDRRVNDLVEISKKTGINIISGTGFYLHNAVPKQYLDWSIEQMAQYIINEISVGIEDSGVKAGIIGEVGSSFPIADFEEKSLMASAMAQSETGACVTVHVAPDGKEGLKAVEILQRSGADPQRVIINHMDEQLDLDYHRALLDKGVTIAYDTFGAEWYYSTVNIAEPSDKERVEGVVKLLNQGYASQIVLSHDVWLKQCLTSYGGMGYAHILHHIVPMLKHQGIKDEQINQMLIENPKRLLQF